MRVVEEWRMAVNWVRNMNMLHSEALRPEVLELLELDQSRTRLRYSMRLIRKKKKMRRWITVGFLTNRSWISYSDCMLRKTR